MGVAEAEIDVVIEALNHLFVSKKQEGSLKMSDLSELGLTGNNDSQELRNNVSSELHLGYTNAKTLLKRLNSMNISKEELKRIVKNAR